MHTRGRGESVANAAPARRSAPAVGPLSAPPSASVEQDRPPDVEIQLERAQRFGHHLDQIPASAGPAARRGAPPSVSPDSAPIQGKFPWDLLQWLNPFSYKAVRSRLGWDDGAARQAAPPQQQPLPPPAPRPQPDDAPVPAVPAPQHLAPPPVPQHLAPPPAPQHLEPPPGPQPLVPPPAPQPLASSVEPPSAEELARQRQSWERNWRRQQSSTSAPSPAAAAASSSSLSTEEEQEIVSSALDNSARLTGHGRALHGKKALARPRSMNEANQRRSQQKAVERTLALAAARKKKEEEDGKKDP